MPDNRTEKATPRRRLKAREHGQVLRSRDLVSAITLLGLVCCMAWRPEAWISGWRAYFVNLLDSAVSTHWDGGLPLWSATGTAVLLGVGPLLLVAFGVAVVSTLAQGAPTFAAEALTPNFRPSRPGEQSAATLFSRRHQPCSAFPGAHFRDSLFGVAPHPIAGSGYFARSAIGIPGRCSHSWAPCVSGWRGAPWWFF